MTDDRAGQQEPEPDVMGGPEPDEERTDVMGGRQPGGDEMSPDADPAGAADRDRDAKR
jgi:hypothetical protein